MKSKLKRDRDILLLTPRTRQLGPERRGERMGWEAMVCSGATASVCAVLPLTDQENQRELAAHTTVYNRGPLSCESRDLS